MSAAERTQIAMTIETRRRAELQYQPALDGVRAVAVLAVLGYHGGLAALSGGFLGVDLFFVLSGYLITSLLIVEHEQAGSIGLAAFWLRRARRLLPALCVVLVGTALYAGVLAGPKELSRIRGDALTTVFYVSNWWFIFRGSSYWEQFTVSPLRHTWSLGIEEQWYILWPLILTPILRLFPERMRRLSLATTGVALCSALLMAVLFDPSKDPSRPYYGTDTRAQTLLLGAALAFVLYRASIPTYLDTIIKTSGVVGALAILGFFVCVSDGDAWMYRGGFTLMAGAATALIAGCVRPGRNFVKSGLSLKPLVLIGRISYGLYLYHWPVYVVLTTDRTGLQGPALIAIRLASTFALAILSHRFVEMPVRSGALCGRESRDEIFALAAMLAIPLGIVLTTTATPVEQVSLATREAPARPNDLRVLVIGDSVATSLGNGFNPDKHAGLSVTSVRNEGCGVMKGRVQRPNRPPDPPTCLNWEQAWEIQLGSMRPDLSVLLVGAWESWDWWVEGRLLEFGTPAFIETLDGQLDHAVAVLRGRGSKVVLLTPPCYRDLFHPEPGAYPPADRHRELVQLFEDYASRRKTTVAILDLAEFVCPGADYRDTLNGTRLRSDGSHFTSDGAALVWDWLAPQLLAMKPVAGTVR